MRDIHWQRRDESFQDVQVQERIQLRIQEGGEDITQLMAAASCIRVSCVMYVMASDLCMYLLHALYFRFMLLRLRGDYYV